MAELEHQLRVPQLFAKARTHLDRAREQRRECIRGWEEIRRHRPFSAWLEAKSENTAELWCAFRPAPEQQEAVDKAAGAFLTEIKSAMDVAVLAAALENVGLSGVVGDKHSMPLCFAEPEFDELPYDGWLMGLRPDQMNVIRNA